MHSITCIPLSEALPSTLYKVVSVELKNDDKKRIFDLGIIPNTILKILHKSPFGNPVAYSVRGSVIALRKDYTNKIIVEKINAK